MKLKPILIIEPYSMEYLIAESPFNEYVSNDEYINEYFRISKKLLKLYNISVTKITLKKDIPKDFLMFDDMF